MNANEFVHATPKEIGKDTVVITASQRGNTAETVKATAVANELGAATVGLTFQVPSPLTGKIKRYCSTGKERYSS